MEQDDGVLGFSKTNIRFEEREFDRKLANGHAELVFWKKCRIIQSHTIAVEKYFEIQLTPSYKYRGVIDRISRTPNGELRITDYKSGRRVSGFKVTLLIQTAFGIVLVFSY